MTPTVPVIGIRVRLVADPGLLGSLEAWAFVTAVGFAFGTAAGVWLAGLL